MISGLANFSRTAGKITHVIAITFAPSWHGGARDHPWPITSIERYVASLNRQGVQNVMVTHALTNPGGPLTLSEIEQAAKLGAYIELVYGGLSEDLLRRDAEVIRAVGASSIVLSTDLGQPQNPLHTDGLLAFYKGLMAHGISEAEIVQMSQTNPAKLLGLKP